MTYPKTVKHNQLMSPEERYSISEKKKKLRERRLCVIGLLLKMRFLITPMTFLVRTVELRGENGKRVRAT